jgi:hypothetical protein
MQHVPCNVIQPDALSLREQVGHFVFRHCHSLPLTAYRNTAEFPYCKLRPISDCSANER